MTYQQSSYHIDWLEWPNWPGTV